MSDEIFTPFTPAAPPLAPAAEPAKTTRSRKAAEPKAPKRERKVKAAVEPVVKNEPPATPRKKRKKRTVPKVRLPKAMKLPVNVMISAMSELKLSDGALFEKLIGLLAGAGKGQRERVLGALKKVF